LQVNTQIAAKGNEKINRLYCCN